MDNLHWDFYSAVTVNKSIATTPTLPTTTGNYGQLHIVDNSCPIVQRTFTCDHVAAAKVASLVSIAKARNSCCKLTATVLGSYTGRLISLNCQQVPGADSWACTIVLQDTDTEIVGTPKQIYDLDNL